jgi:hypothetical protein
VSDRAAHPALTARRAMHEPLPDLIAASGAANYSPDERLTADRVAVWWAGLPLWRQLAWSDALLSAPPRQLSGFTMSWVRGGPSTGKPVSFRDWHAVAFSFDRVGIDHEAYRAIREAVTRVVAAREASGLGPEHPAVRRNDSGAIYLWGDDWRGLRSMRSSAHDTFERVLRYMTRAERRGR